MHGVSVIVVQVISAANVNDIVISCRRRRRKQHEHVCCLPILHTLWHGVIELMSNEL